MHCHPGTPEVAMVLVHGLGGGAYKTWGALPRQIFESRGDMDLGVYGYRSGLRRRPTSAGVDFHVQRLERHLYDLRRRYRGVYLIGHSLGGVIARAAVRGHLERLRMTEDAGSHGIHAVVSIASPHLGSQWAARIPSIIARDLRYLTTLNKRLGHVQTFFETYVDSANVPFARRGQIVLPMYAIQAGDDLFVKATSAFVGVPDLQQRRLDGGHSSILHNSALLGLLREIIGEREIVLEQLSRQEPYRITSARSPRQLRAWSAHFLSDRFTDQWELTLRGIERHFHDRLPMHTALDPDTAIPPLVIVVFHEETYLQSASDVDRFIHEAIEYLASASGGLVGFIIAGSSGSVQQSVSELRMRLMRVDAIRNRFYVKAALSPPEVTQAIGNFFDLLVDTRPPDLLEDPWNMHRAPLLGDDPGLEDS